MRGRPPGAKNKRPSGIAIGQSLAAKGVDLAERLLALADNTQDDSIRLKAYELLCKYSQVVPTSEQPADDIVSEIAADISNEELARSLS